MARYIKTIKAKTGVAPGTLMYSDDSQLLPVTTSCYLRKNQNTIQSKIDLEEVIPTINSGHKFWINITGNPSIEWFQELGEKCGVHRLSLEDILNPNQRPMMERFDAYVLYCVKMIYKSKAKKGGALMEHLSILQFPNGVVTFQYTDYDTFDGIRNRLTNVNTRIYELQPDYMVFCILDTLVDHYMVVTETIGRRIDKLEDQLLRGEMAQDFILKFSMQQRELNVLRKNIHPLKELLMQCLKVDNAWIQFEHQHFFNDVNDHLILVTETVDTYRDLLSDILNMHSTLTNNNMNRVMKTLTIFSAVFIPITFIAGVYGTNFEYLPELGYRYSYFIFWGVLVAVAALMLFYFKKKRWF